MFKLKSHNGFTLIELAFGVLISALLVTMLYICLHQLQRAAVIADDILSVDTRVLTFKNQLSRDLAGAFMPKATEKESSKYFFGESDQGNLRLLTFITVNPLRTAIETNPKIVRVRYQVSSEPEQPDAYQIQRTEVADLNYSALKEQRTYTVIDGIKALKVTYFMPEESTVAPEPAGSNKPSEKATGAGQASSNPKTSKANKAGKNISNKSELLQIKLTAKQAGEFKNLPAYIKFNLELWDSHEHRRSTSYELDLPVYTYKQVLSAKEKKPSEKANTEKDQAEKAPSAPTPVAPAAKDQAGPTPSAPAGKTASTAPAPNSAAKS